MISNIKGKLTYKNPAKVVIETMGLGFEIMISTKTYEKLPKTGEEVFLETYMHVREDAISLIGFNDSDEKEIFLKLTSVSGVSVKIALSTLSIYNTNEIVHIIESKQTEMLQRVPGIGGKLSSRIILELQDKFKENGIPFSDTEFLEKNKLSEVKEALKSLGYSNSEIMKAISKLDIESVKGKNIEEILRAVLREV